MMPMVRSPDKSSSLSNLAECSLDTGFVNPRKRKQPDLDDFECMFRKFTVDMQTSLNNFKAEVNMSIVQHTKDIKEDLVKLTSTSNEIKSDIEVLRGEYSKIKTSVQVINQNAQKLTETVSALETSVEFTSERVDKLQERIGKSEQQLKEYNKPNQEVQDLKKSLHLIQKDQNQSQQRDRLLNLEIIGVPEKKAENTEELLFKIASHAQTTLSRDDYVHVNRVQPRQVVPGRPRTIVAKLKSRDTKDSIIAGIRKARGINTKDLGFTGEPTPIYVKEHLTTVNKDLLKKCKTTAVAKNYQFVWVKNCRIFMRQHEKAPPMLIQSEEDLRKIN